MVDFGLFDYIINTRGYYNDVLTMTNYQAGLSNVELTFKNNYFMLDSNVLISEHTDLYGLSLDRNQIINSPNLFSFNVKMSNVKETYIFNYLKLPQAFANVMGIMEACKFVFLIFSMILNFLYQNLNFFNIYYTRKEKIVKG
jgi:hypothetical protein